MLTITAPSAQLSSAQFQYADITFEVASTTSLIGEVIYVRPALWKKNQVLTDPSVPSIGYKATYSTDLGTSEMTLFGVGEVWKNGRVLIEYVDAKNFKVHFRFLHLADWGGYLGANSINSLDYVIKKTFGDIGSSVYDIVKYLTFELTTSGGSAAVSNVPYQAKQRDKFTVSYALQAGAEAADGYSTAQDLTISFQVDGQFIGGDFYFGIFRNDQASGNLEYASDLNLQYCLFDGAVTQADQFPVDKINQGTLISLINGNYKGSITLDASYFQEGGTYQFFIAYNTGAQWHSWLSPDIIQRSAETAPGPVYGDVSYQVKTYDSNSNVYTASCVNGIAAYERVKVRVSMDKASYFTAAQAEGAQGTLVDNFVGVDVYFADRIVSFKKNDLFPLDPSITQPQSVDVVCSALGDECYVEIDFRIPGIWAGSTRYVNFIWNFDLGDHHDYINTPVILEIPAENTTVITSSEFTGEFTDVICNTNEGDIILTLGVSLDDNYDIIPVLFRNGKIIEEDQYSNDNFPLLSEGIISGPGSALSSDTELVYTIDSGQLVPRTDYCLRFIFKAEGSDVSNPDGSSCTCFTFDAEQTVLSVNNFTAQLQFTFDAIDDLDFLGYEVETWTVKVTDQNDVVIANEVFLEGSGQMVFEYPTPLYADCFYNFEVLLTNGCRFSSEFIIQSHLDPLITVPLNNQDICDPDGSLQYISACLNNPTVEASCDDGSGSISLTKGGSVLSTPTLDKIQYSLNGFDGEFSDYSSPVITDEIWTKRVFETSDGCPDIEVLDHFVCVFTETECNDAPDVSTVYDADALELTILNTGTVECSFSSDTLEYSDDDGASFTTYAGPIDVTSIDELIIQRTLECSDGCPTVVKSITWNKSAKLNCDYSAFGLTVNYDEGLNVHTASRDGLDSDLITDSLLYSEDGGETFNTYSGGVSADVVLFMRILQFENCDQEIIAKASARSCCEITGDHKLYYEDVNSGNTVTVDQNVAQVVAVFRNGRYERTSNWSRVGNTFTFTNRDFASGEWVEILYL